MRKQVEVLEDQADPQPDAVDEIVFLGRRQRRRRRAAHFDVADPDRALVEPLEPVQAAEHRGLAAAGRPEDGRELGLGDAEGGAVQHGRRAVALDDVGDFDHGATISTHLSL